MEFAVVAPIFFLLILGIIEFGRAFLVQQALTNASREGARRAVLEHATAIEVEMLVENYLADCSVSGATVEVTPSDLSTVGFGDPVAVEVAVPYSSVSWLPAPFFLGEKTLSATSTMHGERPQ